MCRNSTIENFKDKFEAATTSSELTFSRLILSIARQLSSHVWIAQKQAQDSCSAQHHTGVSSFLVSSSIHRQPARAASHVSASD